jgi:glucose/arabinose dehydrogenase
MEADIVSGMSALHACRLVPAVTAAVWVGVMPASVAAATLRPGFTETVVASGIARPTAMAFAPDGRLFICEQGGRLRVVKDDVLLSTPFLTVTVNSAGERGLLGVAVDPNFQINRYIYVYYTATTPFLHNRVSRFTANGDVAQPGSEFVILELDPLTSATNHNGGGLHFGLDGFLYVGVGENAIPAYAQSLNNRLGKILRIGTDGSIPANPFDGLATGANRAIWALGLRNPFTFAIDLYSGRMLINDVGASAWEEINEGFAGANYGWPEVEGPASDGRFSGPVHAYPHGSGVCAISGGAFYPPVPTQFPAEYAGDYFFADFCGGWIRQFDVTSGIQPGDFASGIVSPVDLRVGADGSLYYLARGSGTNTGAAVRISFSGADTSPGGRRAVRRAPRTIDPVRRPPVSCGEPPEAGCGGADVPAPPPGAPRAIRRPRQP